MSEATEFEDEVVGVFNVAVDGALQRLEFVVKVCRGDGEDATALADDGAEGNRGLVFMYLRHAVKHTIA